METEDIVRCALQIEKLSADGSFGPLGTLLSTLSEWQVTAEQLQTTEVVKVLYRLLRSCSDTGLKKAARSLLSKWKRQCSTDLRAATCTGTSQDPEDGGQGVSQQGGSQSGCGEREEEEEAASSEDKPDLQAVSFPAEGTPASSKSSIRSKCVQLLLAALRSEPSTQDEAAELATNIEEHIHELHRSSPVRYKACVRSKVANLRNPRSRHLVQGLLSGSLSPQAFARMSSEEMAGAELRRLRKEYSSRGVSERQLPQQVEGTPTQKIRCKRCGGSDCRVTQVSRGALFLPAWVRRGGPDEDAMTFVTCGGCGQQWYHSGWVCL